MNIPDEIHKLIKEYKQKYNKSHRRFNYDEWNNFDEYKEYLEKELDSIDKKNGRIKCLKKVD